MYRGVAGRRRELQVLIGVFAAILLIVAIVAVMGGQSGSDGVCIADDAPTKFDQGTLSEEDVFDGSDCVEDLQPLP